MSASLLTKSDDFRNQSFTIKDRELFVDMDSRDLDAYVWHAPGDVHVYFVFIEQEVHLVLYGAIHHGDHTVLRRGRACQG